MNLYILASQLDHYDTYKCGCAFPNGSNHDSEFDFVCDDCYEAAQPDNDHETKAEGKP